VARSTIIDIIAHCEKSRKQTPGPVRPARPLFDGSYPSLYFNCILLRFIRIVVVEYCCSSTIIVIIAHCEKSRKQTPGPVRPARPLRCSADARETKQGSRDCETSRGFGIIR